MATKYILNVLTGKFDAINATISGTTIVGSFPYEYITSGGDDTIVHSIGQVPNNIAFKCPFMNNAILLANDIRVRYIAHIADAVAHAVAADGVNTMVSGPATDWTTLIALVTEELIKYPAHNGDVEPLYVGAYHGGANTAPHTLSSVVAPTTPAECITRLLDLKAKFNAHDADNGSHAAISTHQVIVADAVEDDQDMILPWVVDTTDATTRINNVIVTSSDIRYIKATLYFS